MPDTMKPREPGEEGTMVGQIKTPMCSTNVGNKEGGKTHNYKKATGDINKTGTQGNSIEGPGVKGNWDTQIKISGNNKKY